MGYLNGNGYAAGIYYNGVLIFGMPGLGANIWYYLQIEVDVTNGKAYGWWNNVYQGTAAMGLQDLAQFQLVSYAGNGAFGDNYFDDIAYYSTGSFTGYKRRRKRFW